MHSVLIVDDEPLVRMSLASLRSWEEDGFELCWEASNGKEALDILAAHAEIDLVLLDLSMPVMNGIDFLRQKKGKVPAVIILSAYDDFHLVRTAFTLGAVDYVLKTEMEPESLLAVLRSAAAGIQEGRDASSSVIERRQVEFLRSQMLRDLLVEAPSSDSGEALASLGISLVPPFFVCGFWVRDFVDVAARYGEEGLQRFSTMVDRSLVHVLSKRGSGEVAGIRADHAVVFFQGAEEAATGFCADAKEYLERYLSIRVSFSLGDVCTKLEDIAPAYKMALARRGAESRMVVQAKRFIRESFANHALSLAEVAIKVGVSKNHLSWEFAREAGETLTEYLARVRIEEAKRLLAATSLKVYEVGERVGYPNVEHFSRVFKKVTGANPSSWSDRT